MKKELHLLIDDIRSSDYVRGVDIIARKSHEGIEILRTGKVTHLYLDNDMGPGEMEGWEIMELAIKEDILPDFVQLVTANPVAQLRMARTLVSEGFVEVKSRTFQRVKHE